MTRPDNETLPRTTTAVAEWRRTEPERQAAWERATTDEECRRLEVDDHIAALKVRIAFYEDTAAINRWTDIERMHVLKIVEAADRAAATRRTEP